MNRTIAQALAAAALDAVDARVLMRHTLGVDDAYLITHAAQALSGAQSATFDALVARRVAGEPVAYITGRREFYGLDFEVTPAVLIPRPETELLVDFALEKIAVDNAIRVLDLGTGSGCVAISIAKLRPHAQVVAVERSAAALAVARANARRLGATNLEIIASDWFGALGAQPFDLIVANPPYVATGNPHLANGDVRCEPRDALAAGADGFDCIRAIVASALRYLKAGGWLAFEHGYDQAARCRGLLAQAGYQNIFSRADIAGIARISGGRRRTAS
jgi:release factor glutamine methyltransferase